MFVAGALVILLAVWGVVTDLPRTPPLIGSAVLITLGVAAACLVTLYAYVIRASTDIYIWDWRVVYGNLSIICFVICCDEVLFGIVTSLLNYI